MQNNNMESNKLRRAKRKLYNSSLKNLEKNFNNFVIIKELSAKENNEITFKI